MDQDEIDRDEGQSRMDRRPDERDKTATKRKIKRYCIVRARISYFSRIVVRSQGKTTRTNTKEGRIRKKGDRKQEIEQQQETEKDDPHALIS